MTVTLYCGDCLDVMREMDECSVDSIVTDPPYGLNFMGKDWDHGVPGVRFWAEALRVAKPGAALLAFGGTRTHHRLMCAIEDAGWELRDVVMWVYGSGFPKSHDISKAIDKAAGAEREVVGDNPNHRKCHNEQNTWRTAEGRKPSPMSSQVLTAPATESAALWDGWGTALKPAWEPIVVAMKPRDGTFADNALKWGVAGLWIDGARVPTNDNRDRIGGGAKGNGGCYGASDIYDYLSHSAGRWPANVIHDGSDEVVGLFPANAPSGGKAGSILHKWTANGRAGIAIDTPSPRAPDSGSAARFFYCAKASRSERNAGLEGIEERAGGALKSGDGGWRNEEARGRQSRHDKQLKVRNHHPTVKPLALMQYLVRLTRTPTGGVVLDPFMGSGTTGMACVQTGRDFIGIEIDPDYFEIAERRIAEAQLQEPLL